MERAHKQGAEKRRSSSPAPEAGQSSLALHQSVGNQALQRAHGAQAGVRVWEGAGADRMLDTLGTPGAALGPDVLVSRNLDWKTRKAVLAHEITHARQTGGRAPSGGVRAVGARSSREERQAHVAGAIGVPLGGGAAAADPGVLRLFDRNELIYGRITEIWVQGLDDDELVEAGAGLRDEMELLGPDTAEYADATANNAVIERALFDRGLDSDRREDLADAIASDPLLVPVAFGVDSTTDEPYVTVAPPGADLEDVAAYLYGTPALAGALGEANGLAPRDLLAPGTVLKMLPDQRSIAAEDALEAGFETGTIIRTEGIPETLEDNGQVYYFKGPAGLMILNCGQLNALLAGIRDRTMKEIGIHLRTLESILAIRNSHEESGAVMRNLIEWWGEVELPSQWRYESWISTAQSTLAEVEGLVFEDDPRATACTLLALQRRGIDIAEAEQQLFHDHEAYFYGFMSSGADLVGKLDFARNVSLALVAGIAGALVAPAAFAALTLYGGYSAATATVLSIGAAGFAGGTARGTLEAVPYVVLDQPGAGDRFASGFYSGSMEGATGGAGSFLTPLVSGMVTSRLAASPMFGQGFVSSTKGYYATQAATGTIIGAPSGVAGAALENLPELATGEMSGGDYAAGLGWGGFYGGMFGLAAPVMPGKGVYRGGWGRVLGQPVTPAWMMAGPFAPATAGVREMQPQFHDLPENALPAFSEDPAIANFNWARLRRDGRNEWVPIRTHGPDAEFELAWYGDRTIDADVTNFNFLHGPEGDANALRLIGMRQTLLPADQHYQGLPADTPEIGMPSSTRRDMPATPDEMAMPLPGGGERRMIVGHNVDAKYTTPRTATIPDSNLDIRNVTPEPWGWGGAPKTAPANLRGFGGREMLIQRMMRERPEGGTQVRQMNVYDRTPPTTNSGKPRPDFIYFIEATPEGKAVRAWRMPFNDDAAFNGIMMNRVAQLDQNFGMRDVGALPPVVVYEAGRVPTWVLAGAELVAGEEETAPAP